MKFEATIPTPSGSRVIRTCEEAVRLIDQEVPEELRRLDRWITARELFTAACQSQKKRDIKIAMRQLSEAASNELW